MAGNFVIQKNLVGAWKWESEKFPALRVDPPETVMTAADFHELFETSEAKPVMDRNLRFFFTLESVCTDIKSVGTIMLAREINSSEDLNTFFKICYNPEARYEKRFVFLTGSFSTSLVPNEDDSYWELGLKEIENLFKVGYIGFANVWDLHDKENSDIQLSAIQQVFKIHKNSP